MDKILILGALPQNQEMKALYEAMAEVCEKFVQSVSSPIDTAKFHGSDSERYKRAFQKVKEADLIIGEQSLPSTGQGIELREAALQGKPVIIVAREGSGISGMVKGSPNIKEIIRYHSLEELKKKLQGALEKG